MGRSKSHAATNEADDTQQACDCEKAEPNQHHNSALATRRPNGGNRQADDHEFDEEENPTDEFQIATGCLVFGRGRSAYQFDLRDGPAWPA